MDEQRMGRQGAAGRPANSPHEKPQLEIPYLSEDKLLSLIEEIEQTDGEYVSAPASVEEQTLKRLEQRMLPVEAGEKRKTLQKTISLEDRMRKKRRELQRYTLRVALSAAASIAVLLAFPLVQQTNLVQPQEGELRMEEKLQRQQEEYEKVKQAQEIRDEKRREKFESRGEGSEAFWQDGLENVISVIRRITK